MGKVEILCSWWDVPEKCTKEISGRGPTRRKAMGMGTGTEGLV